MVLFSKKQGLWCPWCLWSPSWMLLSSFIIRFVLGNRRGWLDSGWLYLKMGEERIRGSHPVHFCTSHSLSTAQAHQSACFVHWISLLKFPFQPSFSLLSHSQLSADHPVCSAGEHSRASPPSWLGHPMLQKETSYVSWWEPWKGQGEGRLTLEVTGLGLEHSCEEGDRVWEGLKGAGNSFGTWEVLRKGREVAASFASSNFKE